MHSREYLSDLIEQHITQLPYPVSPARLYQPIAYGMDAGGKRLRPLLLVMSYNIFSDDCQSVLDVASAVEMFHNFTLLHDDIMDNSAVRRGRPAVHKKWGNNTAILSGDAMVIYSYSLLSRCEPKYLAQVLETFNKMAMEVCEGQQFDIDFESLGAVPMDDYMNMIRLKTSVLLAGAAEIGAILGGATTQQSQTIYQFAVELGLAFQIQDDLLDTYGTQEQLGKPIGGDILEGKKTFLMITAMENADSKVRSKIRALLENDTISNTEKINSMRYIYDSLGVKQCAQQAIEKHLATAVSALETIDVPHDRLEPLKEVVGSLLNRNK